MFYQFFAQSVLYHCKALPFEKIEYPSNIIGKAPFFKKKKSGYFFFLVNKV